MGHNHKHIDRRDFLGKAACGAMGYTTLFSTLFNLKTMNAAAIANSAIFGGDYKALVCVFFAGGNDAFNMLVPKNNNAEYEAYANARSNVAIPQGEILPLEGSDYGLHPAMGPIQSLYDDGKLSFISNIGTLIQPVENMNQVYDGSIPIPLGLFSHSDQSQQWQTSVPHDRTAIGWGGKVADLLGDMNTNQNISLNISLAGNNVFQNGENSSQYVIDPYSGAIQINGYGDPWLFGELRTAAIDNMIEANYQDLYKKTYVDVIKVSRDSNIEFAEALDSVELSTEFSDNEISNKMKMVARTIAARNTLDLQRQIFFVEVGGFDMHDEVVDAHTEALTNISLAFSEFNTAMEELETTECVTTFTISEFARTLASNGNGTDHAWGSNVMVMGGQVNGGNIFGNYPTLALGSSIDLGGGVLIPDLSADEYFAELSRWFGVSDGDLATLFPNLGNFYFIDPEVQPIGFLPI
jgi:uncharacterized protein (DUF1501 family)